MRNRAATDRGYLSLRTYRRYLKPLMVLMLAAFLSLFLKHLYSSIYGVPPGYTGAPYDGYTCATLVCHTGPAKNVTGWISTDVPVTGYQPGDTYNITLTATRPATSKFGFLMTTQGVDGITGSFIVTDPVETQYSQGPGYITHRIDGTSGNDQKSWQAKWIAPADTFYTEITLYAAIVGGVFLIDEEVFLTERKLTSAYININEALPDDELLVYPNPFSDHINIKLTGSLTETAEVSLFNMSGAILFKRTVNPGADKHLRVDIPGRPARGMVFLEIRSESSVLRRKLVCL